MRHFLENATGLSIYPLISFVIFGIMFLFVTYYTFFIRKEVVEQMANLPLDSDHNRDLRS